MIQPYDYYIEGDSIAETISDIKRNITQIQTFAQQQNYEVFWRGQGNHEWGLVSSLVRKLSAAAVVDDSLLNKVEEALLKEAVAWIQDLRATAFSEPLAQLAYLQHHGIPTRLLDFTKNPWMAVFFAAESHDEVDGRIFAILVNSGDVLRATPRGTPWRSYGTNEVKVYDPSGAGISFPRVAAQDGVLAVARLPSTQPHRKAKDPVLGRSRSLPSVPRAPRAPSTVSRRVA